MTEQKNPYEMWDFSSEVRPQFSNTHMISHTAREFFVTFGVGHPPQRKITPLTQVVLTKEHMIELILNLQSQLKKLQSEQK